MSYSEKLSVKYQNSKNAAYSQAEYTRLSSVIASNIKKICLKVNEIEKKLSQIGTEFDTSAHRKQLFESQNQIKELCQITSKHLSDVRSLPSPDDSSEQQQRMLRLKRLTAEFEEVLKSVDEVQSKAVSKEKDSVTRARARTVGNTENVSSPLLQNVQETAQVSLDMQVLKDREEALQKLESNILDVNQIFRDIALIVEEQGEIVDSIEAHVSQAEEKVETGKVELHKATINQSKARKKKFICWSVIIAVVIVIIIIIVISVSLG